MKSSIDKGETMTDATAERSFQGYGDKEPSDLHTHLAEWIKTKTGYNPDNAASEQEAFLKGVQLGALLRMEHQASPENKERRESLATRTAKAREEAKAAKQAEREQAKAAKEAAKAQEAQEKAAKATKPEATPDGAGNAEAQPTRQRGPKAAEESAANAAF